MLFACLKKRIPTAIFFALSLPLSCGYVFGLIIDIIDSLGSTTYNKPSPGFYLLIFGQVVMVASCSWHGNLIKQK